MYHVKLNTREQLDRLAIVAESYGYNSQAAMLDKAKPEAVMLDEKVRDRLYSILTNNITNELDEAADLPEDDHEAVEMVVERIAELCACRAALRNAKAI